jgi:limonene-1,2-epoxide hydrolase
VKSRITFPKPGGGQLDVKGVNFYRVRDGKIVYFANYHDTKPFA